jgi:hypothetical protein
MTFEMVIGRGGGTRTHTPPQDPDFESQEVGSWTLAGVKRSAYLKGIRLYTFFRVYPGLASTAATMLPWRVCAETGCPLRNSATFAGLAFYEVRRVEGGPERQASALLDGSVAFSGSLCCRSR